ncbi:MAG: hypothetical protein ACRC2M_23125 [Planktothrix sp.]
MTYLKNDWKIYNINNQIMLQNLSLDDLKKLAFGLDQSKFYAKQAGSDKEIALWQF